MTPPQYKADFNVSDNKKIKLFIRLQNKKK